jgi:hypothetical protein
MSGFYTIGLVLGGLCVLDFLAVKVGRKEPLKELQIFIQDWRAAWVCTKIAWKAFKLEWVYQWPERRREAGLND